MCPRWHKILYFRLLKLLSDWIHRVDAADNNSVDLVLVVVKLFTCHSIDFFLSRDQVGGVGRRHSDGTGHASLELQV